MSPPTMMTFQVSADSSCCPVPPNTPVSGWKIGPPGAPNGHDLDLVAELHRSLSDLAELRDRETQVGLLDEEEQAGAKDKVLVIGISGPSSSGKTTLAIILSEIFTTRSMAPPCSLENVPTNTSSRVSHDKKKKEKQRQNLLIHQDLFFYNKGAAETTTFQSRPADVAFCRRTLQLGDEVGEYILSEDGQGGWNIGGPDTDHISAINMWGLLKTVLHVRERGELPGIVALERMLAREEYGMPMSVRVTKEFVEDVKRQHADIIISGRKMVEEWTMEMAMLNRRHGFSGRIVHSISSTPSLTPTLLFVEGFLLYHKPRQSNGSINTTNESTCTSTSSSKPPIEVSKCPKQQREDVMAYHLLHRLAKKLKRGEDCTSEELDYIQEHHYLALQRAFVQLMPVFDIKLFLSTSRDVAKKRRMQRAEYVDAPAGTRRPGEMWKTEGYFEDVVWRNHVLAHDWLVDWRGGPLDDGDDGRVNGGIDVRRVNAGVEETVEWAIRLILKRLAVMEEEMRVEVVGPDVHSLYD